MVAVSEITVILKDSERTYRHKNLVYKSVTLDPNDPDIRAMIEDAKQNFQGEPETVRIKASMEC